MNDDSSTRRSSARALLGRLTETIEAETDGNSAPMRHLGIAALNLAAETDPETLITAGRALPWLAIYERWQQEDVTLGALVELIERHELVHHLGERTLLRRLGKAATSQTSYIRRTPESPDEPGTDALDIRAELLIGIVDHDLRLRAVANLSPHRRRDALLDDAGLLATTLEICADDGETSTSEVLRDVLPDWSAPGPSPALEVLARFESGDFELIPDEFAPLGDRARRFEQSLARHLNRHGLLYALRAALAFAMPVDKPPLSQRRLRQFLTGFTVFAEDGPLLDLTLALITVRRRTIEHLRGALPLDALSPWITYLRGPCAEFSEERGITLREATNFAHYAFHLLNLCDLAVEPDTRLTEPLRRALMDIENELKEFALVGQRQGLTDEQSDLHRYERTRWRNDGPRGLLADRLSRLCGGFRGGHRSGPLGSPSRPDHKLYDICRELIGETDGDPEIDATAHLIQRTHFKGHHLLNGWTPGDALSLLIAVLSSARRASTIDVDQPFAIDLSPLKNWLQSGDPRRRATIVQTLLRLRGPEELATAPLLRRSTGLAAEAEHQRLSVTFFASPEVEALLTLMASAGTDDAAFVDSLSERLDEHLHATESKATDELDLPSPDAPRNALPDDPGSHAGQ